MGRNLLFVGLALLMIVGSPKAQEEAPPNDMEFIEFLGTFEKDVDPLMLTNLSKLKRVSPKSPQRGFSYEKKNMEQEDARDE